MSAEKRKLIDDYVVMAARKSAAGNVGIAANIANAAMEKLGKRLVSVADAEPKSPWEPVFTQERCARPGCQCGGKCDGTCADRKEAPYELRGGIEYLLLQARNALRGGPLSVPLYSTLDKALNLYRTERAEHEALKKRVAEVEGLVPRIVRTLKGKAALVLALLCLAAPAHAALTVRSVTANAAILEWTAPGDDGDVGTASIYEMRYNTFAPADTSQGATGIWWNAANSVSSLPTPLVAGTRQSVTAAGLDAGFTYYFVIRAADEASNWSLYSNVATKPIRDVTAPSRIVDQTAR